MVRIEGSWRVGEKGPRRGGKDFHFSVSRLRRKALVLTSHIFTSTTAVVEERPREGKEGPLLDSGLFTQVMGPEVGLQWH